jgi:outer membrane protein OmpA-like peptidoglycan-associated protein
MRMKFIATLLLGIALCYADVLAAQVDSTAAKKPLDPKSPAALSWRKNKKTAKKLLKKNQAEAAIPYLAAGVDKKPKKKYFAKTLAPAELEVRDYKASNKWYKVLVDKDSVKHKKSAYLFQYAVTQKYLGQYEAAIATFTKFKKVAGEDDESVDLKRRATREIMGCQKGIFFRDSVANPAFKVKHLETGVNQPLADFAPRLRDNALYYSSQTSDNSFSRIYKAIRQGKNFGAGEAISDNINVAGLNVGNGSFSADGNTLYYTQCKTEAKTNKLKCAIYKSKLENGVWGKGESVGTAVNDPLYNTTQPATGLNKDGEEVLYFVSDRNPGKGLDLFYAKINPDGTVGKPRSAGPQVNSKGDEVSPYFDYKSKTLYFSSNGWISIGGFDVFKSTWDANGEWTEPENLGTPVNSSADDYDFSINDKSTLGFVVSNRPGGFGLKSETCCDDIYQVETTKLFLAARGNVYEEKDSSRGLADHGLVMLYDERNGTELGSYNLISGGYFFDLQPKTSYKLVTRKDGYYDGVSSFNTNSNVDNDTLKYDLFLKKKAEQALVNPLFGRVIGKIYYDYDQSRLRADSRDTLRAVMDIMNQYPNFVIEVGAHTDGKGTEDYNIALSKRRADAVMNYYIYEKKVSKYRLQPKAYGTSQPAADNKTADGKDNPAGRALNRRTEFKIIGEVKLEEKPKQPNKKEEEVKPAAPMPKVVKKDLTPAKTTGSAKSLTPVPAAKAEVKPAPVRKPVSNEPAAVTGTVYIEKAGARSVANQAAVFLSSNEGGYQQKVFYVKADGGYSFDLTHAAADTFKLIARKYQFESNEVVFTANDIRTSTKPINLVIKMK